MAASFLAIGIAGLALLLSPLLVAAAFLIAGLGNALYNVSVRTILHTDVPEALHGRAGALYGFGIRGAEAAGFVAGGLFGPSRVLIAYTASGLTALAASLPALAFARRVSAAAP